MPRDLIVVSDGHQSGSAQEHNKTLGEARKYELEFTLLSDVDRQVVNAYDATFTGLGGIEGYVSANRVVVVIDKDGVVQHRWDAESPGVEPDYEAVVALASSL